MNAVTESGPTDESSKAAPPPKKLHTVFGLRSLLVFVAAAAVLCGGFFWLGGRWPALLLVGAGVTLAIRWSAPDLGMMVIWGGVGGCLGGLCCALVVFPTISAHSRGLWGLAAWGLGLFGLVAGIVVATIVALALRPWQFQTIEEQKTFATRLSVFCFACAASALALAALFQWSRGS